CSSDLIADLPVRALVRGTLEVAGARPAGLPLTPGSVTCDGFSRDVERWIERSLRHESVRFVEMSGDPEGNGRGRPVKSQHHAMLAQSQPALSHDTVMKPSNKMILTVGAGRT